MCKEMMQWIEQKNRIIRKWFLLLLSFQQMF